MNNKLNEDVALKEAITLKEAADILGLKYHTARNLLRNEKSIRCINYGLKVLWIKDDVFDFKRRCVVTL